MTDSSPQPAPKPVPFQPEREVRFAVVMYGGVSLAIYINGVAQELLNMVRATAPSTAAPNENWALLDTAGALKGSTRVYRKLGQYLHHDLNKLRVDSNGKPAEQTADLIRTRFVVDVISGTSAGGINGVFLAKALAMNQEMEGLKGLWLSEGDLGKLLNDPLSVADLRESGLSVQEPQKSLLNSQRMYRKLLDALAQMEENPSANSVYDQPPEFVPSPLVNELDLFITTTDIEGIPLPVALSDMVVFERRYKNVFHFRHDPAAQASRKDFEATNDPFLAFAARCTSSFPFAFEPMRLADIDAVTENYTRYRGAAGHKKNWDDFFRDYLRLSLFDLDKEACGGIPDGSLKQGPEKATEALREAFCDRAFGDGGYLDNKPFSHATAMLMRRHSDYLVDRKMMYVEPSPEHPELMPSQARVTPNFAENIRAAVLELPRQETIREDLDALDERNRMVNRVATFAREVDADVLIDKKEPLSNFGSADLHDMMRHYGISYGAYHRLKVGEVTSYLAEFVTRAKGHDPSSDAGTAIRALVAAWRRSRYYRMKPPYTVEPPEDETRGTENKFLLDFDIRFRLRRIIFLIRRVNELSQLNLSRMRDVDYPTNRLLGASLKQIEDEPELDQRIRTQIEKWLQSPAEDSSGNLSDWLLGFRRELLHLKKEHLAKALAEARTTEERFLRSSSSSHLADPLKEIDLPWSVMKNILDCQGCARTDRANEILKSHHQAINELAKAIRGDLVQRKTTDLKVALAPAKPSSPKPDVSAQQEGAQYTEQGALAARLCLLKYHENFIRYDMVIYPLQYGTGAGEANVVEVFRISPEDATSLIEERRAGENRRKLAGTALMSFGAFVDRGWRKNDMLWGRLDGAERLITALWPAEADETIRDGLIKEAQMAILEEEVKSGDMDAIKHLLSNALARYEPSSEHDRNLRRVVEGVLEKRTLPEAVGNALRQCLADPDGIWSYYKKNFEVNRRIDPETALRLISRATNVTGKMLEGLAEKYGSDRGQRTAVWIARLGSVFWSLVAVAVPGSLANLFVRHWLALLYLFSGLMILAGIVIKDIKGLGWQALGLTAALNLVILLLGDFISGERRRLSLLRGVAVAGLLALIACGMLYVVELLGDPIEKYKNWLAGGTVLILLLLLGTMEVRRRQSSGGTIPRASATQAEKTPPPA